MTLFELFASSVLIIGASVDYTNICVFQPMARCDTRHYDGWGLVGGVLAGVLAKKLSIKNTPIAVTDRFVLCTDCVRGYC